VTAKAVLLAFADGDIADVLRSLGATGSDRAAALVRRTHLGYDLTAMDGAPLSVARYSGHDEVYAISTGALDLVCDLRLDFEAPSELPEHLHELGRDRRIVYFLMHSGAGVLGYAVWDHGRLVRTFSLTPDGIVENLGEPLPVERPFWAGEHDNDCGTADDEDPDKVAFDPFELGEEVLRDLFGFVSKGCPTPPTCQRGLAVRLPGHRPVRAGHRRAVSAHRDAATARRWRRCAHL
jgi:hypothetical protein